MQARQSPGKTLLVFVGDILIAYFAVTAFAGYRVGLAIRAARTNPYVGIASSIAGRDATEQAAISQTNTPDILTKSPFFWLALRLSE